MSVLMTDNAAQKINELIASEENAIALRVGILGGGCSGFNYSFAFAEARSEDDDITVHNEATIFVDPMSLMYLDGATIDYTKSLAGEQFTVSNPNAQSTCGCGTSFSV